MRQSVGDRDGFGDSEIEQSHLVAGADLDIGRLDVAVDNGPLSSINVGREGVHAIELVTNFARIADSAGRLQPLFRLDDLGYAFAFHILHGDEEAAVRLSVVVDFERAGIDLMKLLLDEHAAAFGFEGQLRVRVARFFDNLEGDLAAGLRIDGQVDVRHAATELAEDFVLAKSLEVQHGQRLPVPLSISPHSS